MIEISPREMLERTLRFWWILVVLAILGGVVGWVFSKFRPPVYEATAMFEVSLNEQQLVKDGLVTEDKLPLDFPSQNVYLTPAADMFYATDLRTLFIADAQSHGISLEEKDFSPESFNLDRRGFVWLISVRSTDPATAARLANMWLADANSSLLEAKAHTTQSLSLGLQRDSVQKCFLELDFTKASQCAGITFFNPADLDTYLKNMQQQIASEQQAGRGIYPALDFVITDPAQAPSSPILYSASLIILAGSLLGLLAGVLVVSLIPASIRRR
ncbi:MAG TPA: hypothetical protein VII93_10815 [Anaerolineales bacterium]